MKSVQTIRHSESTRLSKVVTVAALLCLVGGVAIVVLVSGGEEEPVYEGRSLSSWLDDFGKGTTSAFPPETLDAFQNMGTNALPYLVEMLSDSPGSTERKLHRLTVKIPVLRGFWQPPPGMRQVQAHMALICLGGDASPAVPMLIPLSERPDTSVFALSILNTVGSSGYDALISIVTNRHRWSVNLRTSYITSLRFIRPEDPRAAEAMILFLDDPDPKVRAYAAQQLANFKTDAAQEVAIVALKHISEDSDHNMRIAVSNALESLERESWEGLLKGGALKP